MAQARPGEPGPGSPAGRFGTVAGRYRLDEPHPGGLPGAERWSATDQILARTVTVTLVTGPRTTSVLDAARRAALVVDPRLVRILDVGSADGTGYVVTEAVEGRTLGALAARAPLAPDQARAVVGEAAAALEAARRRGVHHLALRPEVVVLTPAGRVVLDGLAVDGELLGAATGGAHAMSRADTVGLVRVLYAALTGRWPAAPTPTGSGTASGAVPTFDEWTAADRPAPVADAPALDTALADAPQHDGAPVPPADLVTGLPADLDTLCVVTLGPHDDGPHSPGELVRELEPWRAVRADEIFRTADAGRWPALPGQADAAHPQGPPPAAATAPPTGSSPMSDDQHGGRPVPGEVGPHVPGHPGTTATPPGAESEAAGARPGAAAAAGIAGAAGTAGAVAGAGAAGAGAVAGAAAAGAGQAAAQAAASGAGAAAGVAAAVASASAAVARQSVRSAFDANDSGPGTRRPGTPPPAAPTPPSFPPSATSGVPVRTSSRQVPTPAGSTGTDAAATPATTAVPAPSGAPDASALAAHADPGARGTSAAAAHGSRGDQDASPADAVPLGASPASVPLDAVPLDAVPFDASPAAVPADRDETGATDPGDHGSMPPAIPPAAPSVTRAAQPDPTPGAVTAERPEAAAAVAGITAAGLAAAREPAARPDPVASGPAAPSTSTAARSTRATAAPSTTTSTATSAATSAVPAPEARPSGRTAAVPTQEPIVETTRFDPVELGSDRGAGGAAGPGWDLPLPAEPPRPAFGQRRFDPTRWVLGLVAIGVVLGVVIAVGNVLRPFSPGDGSAAVAPAPSVTSALTQEPTQASGDEQPAEAAPATDPPVIASVSSIDPSDGDGEHEELVGRLTDGDPATSWYTHTYNRPDYAGFKEAVGLVVTLQAPATVTSVTLDVNGSGGNVEVRSTDAANPTAGDVLASGPLSAQTVLTLSQPTETQSIVLWFTSLAQAPDGANKIEISSLSVG